MSGVIYSGLNPQLQGHMAYMRFGLGPKPDTPAVHWSTSGAAYTALKNELQNPRSVLIPDVPLNRRIEDGIWVGNPNGVATADECGRAVAEKADSGNPMRATSGDLEREGDLKARFRIAQVPTIGFVERLVLFWSNHFNVHFPRGITTQVYTGHMERKVIRPNVLGNFATMLKQVVKHPAMLAYLDNNNNIGPNSRSRDLRNKHINENLAREVLELHTVGATYRGAGVYEQADVNSLAAILTGFVVGGQPIWRSYYDKERHEEGTFTVLNRVYPQTYSSSQKSWSNMTPNQLDNVLDDLATHEATAHHLATKMIRHFITDNPPQDAVQALANAYLPNGDLKAMANALLDLRIGWTHNGQVPYRLRTPQLSVIAMNRALNLNQNKINDTWKHRIWYLHPLTHNVWQHEAPDGYSDLNASWLNEGSFRARMIMTNSYVLSIRGNTVQQQWPSDVSALAERLFPGMLSQSTRDLINTLPQGEVNGRLALLFMSTEFLRR